MSLFNELKRRNVFKVGAAYLVLSWIMVQVVATAVPALHLPEWVNSLVFLLGAIGFPFALLFAWAFELTPEGLKKESEVTRDKSITPDTGNKINYGIIGLLVIALGYFVWGSFSNNVVSDDIASQQPKIKQPLKATNDNKDILGSNEKSIAVLPFTNMAANEKNESFTLGIHDDLLTHLSKISALKVISRTSVLRYKSTEKAIADIANELGVNNILEGSVQSSGNQIRINVQLIDAKTDEHLWAEIYDRKLTTENIFNIQTEISTKIAAALKAQLSPQEQQSLAKRATNNLDAYHAYLAGRQHMLSRTSEDLNQALKLFQRATALDPNYALAYVGQADTLNLLTAYSTLMPEEMFKRGNPLIAKALSIDPLLAEAHTSKAAYLIDNGQFQAAEKSFQYSLTLNPNYATTYHWYSGILKDYTNQYQKAYTLAQKAATLDPISPVIQNNLASALFMLGRFDEAQKRYKYILEFAPDYPGAYGGMADIDSQIGQFDQAFIWRKKALDLDTGNLSRYISLAIDALNLDDLKRAQSVLKLMKKRFPNRPINQLLKSFIYLHQDKKSKALDGLLTLYKTYPDYPLEKGFIFTFLLKKDYKKAQQLLLKQDVNNKNKNVDITIYNIEEVINLAWVYQQSGEDEKAKPLILSLQKALADMPPSLLGWNKVLIEAIQGHHNLAARAYANMIKMGGDQVRFIHQSLPYFEPIKQQPEYIKAQQIIMERLKQQRQNLADMEATQ